MTPQELEQVRERIVMAMSGCVCVSRNCLRSCRKDKAALAILNRVAGEREWGVRMDGFESPQYIQTRGEAEAREVAAKYQHDYVAVCRLPAGEWTPAPEPEK